MNLNKKLLMAIFASFVFTNMLSAMNIIKEEEDDGIENKQKRQVNSKQFLQRLKEEDHVEPTSKNISKAIVELTLQQTGQVIVLVQNIVVCVYETAEDRFTGTIHSLRETVNEYAQTLADARGAIIEQAGEVFTQFATPIAQKTCRVGESINYYTCGSLTIADKITTGSFKLFKFLPLVTRVGNVYEEGRGLFLKLGNKEKKIN